MDDTKMEKCSCHGMCCGMHGHHHWVHLIIKIAIAIFIFWCGVQFGELKGALHSQYMNNGYGGYGMMGAR